MTERWWVSCRDFTIQVNTDERGIIVWAAPIARRFVGQYIANLLTWKRGTTWERL